MKVREYSSIVEAPTTIVKVEGKRISLPPPYNKRDPNIHERDIQKAILKELRQYRIDCWRIQSQGQIRGETLTACSHKGMPDIIGILPDGTMFAIEVKAPGGTVSPEQVAILDTIQVNGGFAGIGVSTKILHYLSAWVSKDYSIKENWRWYIA
jgi:hypothetical protein